MPNDTCPRAQYQNVIGQNAVDVAFPLTIDYRILRPEDAASTDFIPDRLNVQTDAQGRVIALGCG